MAISDYSLLYATGEEDDKTLISIKDQSSPHSFTAENSVILEEDDYEEEDDFDDYEEEDEEEEEEVEEFVGVKKETKTTEVIKNLKEVGASSNKSIIEKLTAIESAMEYLQKELRQHEGSISEIDFGFPQNRMMTSLKGGRSNSNVACNTAAIWIDHGHSLLAFIQKCLRNSAKYANIIRWTNEKDLEFKIVDPEKFAKMWGTEKRKEGMTKRKLTRSLAYLVNAKGRLRRSTSRTFVYQIVPGSEKETETPSLKGSPSACNTSAPSSPVTPIVTPAKKRHFSAEQLKQVLEQNPQYKNIFEKMLLRKKRNAACGSIQLKQEQQQQKEQQEQHITSSIFNQIGFKRPISCPVTPMNQAPKVPKYNLISPMTPVPDTISYMPNYSLQLSNQSTFLQSVSNQSWRSLLDDDPSMSNFQQQVPSFENCQYSSPLSVNTDCTDTDVYQIHGGSPMSDTSSSYQVTDLNNIYSDHPLLMPALPPSFTGGIPQTDDISFINPTFSLTSTTNGIVDTSAPSGINYLTKMYLQ